MKARLSEAIGGSSQEAESLAAQTHDHAALAKLHLDHALVQIHQSIKGSCLIPIDGATSRSERREKFAALVAQSTGTQVLVSLDQLLGDMDFCECDECQDVTSPTP